MSRRRKKAGKNEMAIKKFPWEHYGITREIFYRLYSADPTTRKKNRSKQNKVGRYSKWILHRYINLPQQERPIFLEDLYKTSEDLLVFFRIMHQLPEEKRNIYNFKTTAELYDIVKPFHEKNESFPFGKMEDLIKKQQVELISEDENGIVISPKTFHASRTLFGNGRTRWCTASSTGENTFKNYTERSPLFVFINKHDSTKLYQMNTASGSFMNSNDRGITREELESIFKKFKPFFTKNKKNFKKWCSQRPHNWHLIPHEDRTEEMALLCFEYSRQAYVYYHQHLKLNDIDERLRTKKVCTAAIALNFYENYKHVPAKHVDEDLCRKAVDLVPDALEHLPTEHITEEIYLIAVKKSGDDLRHIKKEAMTPSIIKTAVEQNGLAVKHVPEESMTDEICKTAIGNNAFALKLLPERWQTEENKTAAFKKNPKIIADITNKIPFIFKLVTKDKVSLNLFPGYMIQPVICKAAVNNSGLELQFVPKNMRTHGLCMTAVFDNEKAIDFVPKQINNFKFRLQIYRKKGNERIFQSRNEYRKAEMLIEAEKRNKLANPVRSLISHERPQEHTILQPDAAAQQIG